MTVARDCHCNSHLQLQNSDLLKACCLYIHVILTWQDRPGKWGKLDLLWQILLGLNVEWQQVDWIKIFELQYKVWKSSLSCLTELSTVSAYSQFLLILFPSGPGPRLGPFPSAHLACSWTQIEIQLTTPLFRPKETWHPPFQIIQQQRAHNNWIHFFDRSPRCQDVVRPCVCACVQDIMLKRLPKEVIQGSSRDERVQERAE